MNRDAEGVAAEKELVYLPRLWRAFLRWIVAVAVALAVSIALYHFDVSAWLQGWLSCSAYFIACALHDRTIDPPDAG